MCQKRKLAKGRGEENGLVQATTMPGPQEQRNQGLKPESPLLKLPAVAMTLLFILAAV